MTVGTKQTCTNKRKGQGNPFHQFREDVVNLCLVYLVERLVVAPPLLCVAGENDPIALPAHVERLRGKGFKRGQDLHKLWPGAGHCPLEEDANGRPAMEFCLRWMLERIK